jgi:hypothetical protein
MADINSDNIEEVNKELGDMASKVQTVNEVLAEMAAELQAITRVGKDVVDTLNKGLEEISKQASSSLTAFHDFSEKLVGGFQSASAAVQIFSGDNKELNEVFEKSMVIVRGLQGVQDIADAAKQAGAIASIFVKKQEAAASVAVATATEAEVVATGAATVATEGATGAFKTLKTAIIETGIGILIILLGELIANWSSVSKWMGSILGNFSVLKNWISGVAAAFRDFAHDLTFGMVDDAQTAAVRAAFDERIEQLNKLKAAHDILFGIREQDIRQMQIIQQSQQKIIQAQMDLTASRQKDVNATIQALEAKQQSIKLSDEELEQLGQLKVQAATLQNDFGALAMKFGMVGVQATVDEYKRQAALLDAQNKDSYEKKRAALEQQLLLYGKETEEYKNTLNQIDILDQEHANSSIQKLADEYKRKASLLEAYGRDSYQMKRLALTQELKLYDEDSEQYKAKLAEIEQLDIAYRQKKIQSIVDGYKQEAQLLEIHHQDSYAMQRKALEEELSIYKAGTDGYKKKLAEIEALDAKHAQAAIDATKELQDAIDNSQRSTREKELFAVDELAKAKIKAGADVAVVEKYVAEEKAKINKTYDNQDKADLLKKLKDHQDTDLLILQNAHASAQAIHEAKAAMYKAEADMRKKNGEDAVKVDAETTAKLKANDKELLASKMASFDKYVQVEQQVMGAIGDIMEAEKNNELATAGNNQKKQEEINRRYFEDNKKLQTATAIINGLVAITKIAATDPDPVSKGILIAAQAISTAATVAKIQSTQYQSISLDTTGIATAPAPINTTQNLINRQSLATQQALNNQQNQNNKNNQNDQPPVFRTYVVDSDIAMSQQRMDKITRLSTH